MNVTDLETVVIDNGSGVLKASFGGDKAPKVVFSSIIGRPNDQDIKDSYIGDEAQMKRSVLNLNYPIEHGIVTNWEDMEKIWNYTFQSKLCIKAEEHRVLLTEAPLNPAEHRNKMTEIMFEVFDSPSLMVAVSGLMSLFGSGRTTGIVLDCGDGVTQCVPVKDGSVFTEAIIRCGYAGRDITDYLIKLLNDRGYSFTTSAEREIVRNIKERLCFIDSFKHEVKLSSLEKRYELPDGRTITLCDERFMCSESLFNSSFPINDRYGIHEMVNFSIKKCDECIREELYGNIVVSGGSTMYEGFPDRVEKEITAIAPNTIDIKVIHSPERKYYAWIGGSLVSCASVLNSLFVTKQEYMEFGPNIAHTKCF